MTWEGLAFKGQALILTWNSYVLSDWPVGLNRSGSWVSPGLKMSLAPLEPIATFSKHFKWYLFMGTAVVVLPHDKTIFHFVVV